MTALGVDYAWQHPDPAQIKAAGYDFVVRYLSNDPTKNLTVAERDSLWAHNLNVLLVWESYAARALAGTQAGIDDARNAVAQAAALGHPPDVPLFFACDTNATANQARPYFKGVASVRPCVGVYGGIAVVDTLIADGTVRYGWQTCAWSAGKVSQVAHLYQRLRPTTKLAGSFDEDVQLHPLPMWTPPQVVVAPPIPIPAPIPAPTLSEDSTMPYMIRTPDGEIDLILAGRLIHLDGPGYDFYAAQKIPLFNVRPQDGTLVRS
jgi:hypothetical protein